MGGQGDYEGKGNQLVWGAAGASTTGKLAQDSQEGQGSLWWTGIGKGMWSGIAEDLALDTNWIAEGESLPGLAASRREKQSARAGGESARAVKSSKKVLVYGADGDTIRRRAIIERAW